MREPESEAEYAAFDQIGEMMDRTDAPSWTGDRISDPEGWWLWLAVDSFPEEGAVLVEAAKASDTAKVTGREWMTLRWADHDNEDDRYLIDEWGSEVVAEPSKTGKGREFWSINLHPEMDAGS